MKYILLIIFLLIPLASAVEVTYKELYSNEIKNNQNVSVEQISVKVRALDLVRAKFDFPDRTDIVSVGDCKPYNQYQVCLLKIRQGDDSEFNITAQEYPLFPKISISKEFTDLSLIKKYDKKTLFVGEKTRVEVLLENKGSNPVSGITYYENYTNGSIISDCGNGCDIHGNVITWEGSLGVSQTQHLYYYFAAEKLGSYTGTAVLNKNITVSEVLTVKTAGLNAIFTYPKTLELGEQAFITSFLSNNNTEQDIFPISYSITIPEGLEIISKTGRMLPKGNGAYAYTEKLEKSSNQSFEFRIIAKKLGNFQIIEESDYYVEGILSNSRNAYWINVTNRELVLSLTKLSPDMVQLAIINPNALAFRNLDITISDGINERKQAYNDLEGHKELYLNFSVDRKNDIDAYIKFETLFGEKLEKTTSIIMPKSDTPNSSNTEIVEDDYEPQIPMTPEQDKSELSSPEKLTFEKKANYYVWIIPIAVIVLLSFGGVILIRASRQKTIEDKLK